MEERGKILDMELRVIESGNQNRCVRDLRSSSPIPQVLLLNTGKDSGGMTGAGQGRREQRGWDARRKGGRDHIKGATQRKQPKGHENSRKTRKGRCLETTTMLK